MKQLLTKLCFVYLLYSNAMPSAAAMSSDDLGRGITTEGGFLLDNCLRLAPEDLIFRSTPSQELSFEQVGSFSSSNNFMSAAGGAGVNLGILGGDIEVRVTTQVTADESSLSFLYYYKTVVGTLGFENVVPFFDENEVCGDSFIQSIKLGYALFINVKLYFLNREELKRVTTKLTVSALFGLIKFPKTFTDETRKLTKDTRYSITAWQLGGNDQTIRDLQHEQFCKLEEGNCYERFARVIEYSKGPLQQEISDAIHNKSYEKMQPLGFSTENYSTFDVSPTPIRPWEGLHKTDNPKQRLLLAIDLLTDASTKIAFIRSLKVSPEDQLDLGGITQKIREKNADWLDLLQTCSVGVASFCNDLIGETYVKEAKDWIKRIDDILNRSNAN